MEIKDIQIAVILDQYMAWMNQRKRLDLEVASDFVSMAAQLVFIKSRMLLPKEVNEAGEEEDPRQELVEQLLQYKMYKYMSYELKDRQLDGERYLYRGPDIPDEVADYVEPVNLDELLGDLTLGKLHSIFKEVMKRQTDKIDPVRSKFGKIEKEEITVEVKMTEVEAYALMHERFSFRDLLTSQSSKTQIVVTFLVILEMMKAGKISIEQEQPFDDIVITSQM